MHSLKKVSYAYIYLLVDILLLAEPSSIYSIAMLMKLILKNYFHEKIFILNILFKMPSIEFSFRVVKIIE